MYDGSFSSFSLDLAAKLRQKLRRCRSTVVDLKLTIRPSFSTSEQASEKPPQVPTRLGVFSGDWFVVCAIESRTTVLNCNIVALAVYEMPPPTCEATLLSLFSLIVHVVVASCEDLYDGYIGGRPRSFSSFFSRFTAMSNRSVRRCRRGDVTRRLRASSHIR